MANKRVNDDGSMKAVIYARYSSENQREESIDGQIRECYAFARKNNISVIAEYIDRAFSAKTDRRPDFSTYDQGQRQEKLQSCAGMEA